MRQITAAACLLGLALPLSAANPRTPLPDEAYDGGVFSAETLSRGGSYASNPGTLASGSENPAALYTKSPNALYVTTLVGLTSVISSSRTASLDPIQGRTINYLALGAERGVVFYEPMGRREERQVIDPANPQTEFRDIEFSADALGFAVAEKWRGGSIGLSFAYLRGTLASVTHSGGAIVRGESDTADGVRLNMGLQYATGPAMWGFSLQNAPGFMFWKDYRRDLLPVKVRFGNSIRAKNGVLLSADVEHRFYNEGGRSEDFYYLGSGWENQQNVSFRAGVYANDIEKPEDRHWTAGITLGFNTQLTLTYAAERYEIDGEKVTRSILSARFPFAVDPE